MIIDLEIKNLKFMENYKALEEVYKQKLLENFNQSPNRAKGSENMKLEENDSPRKLNINIATQTSEQGTNKHESNFSINSLDSITATTTPLDKLMSKISEKEPEKKVAEA